MRAKAHPTLRACFGADLFDCRQIARHAASLEVRRFSFRLLIKPVTVAQISICNEKTEFLAVLLGEVVESPTRKHSWGREERRYERRVVERKTVPADLRATG